MEETQTRQQVKLSASARVDESGQFDILAISAGEGNGWQFGEQVLRESLELWDGTECFVDHAWGGRSLRDLAGVCYKPGWDAERRGVRLKLRPLGPSAGLLSELGRQMLAETGPRPEVGFSADLLFSANGREVKSILRVLSVDLVMDPARGGAFVRALNARQAGIWQDDNQEKEINRMTESTQVGVEVLAEAAQELKLARCASLLEAKLGEARLPEAAARRLRAQFSGQVFEAQALETAIEDTRQLVSALTGGLVVQGPGKVSGMVSSEDQVNAALHDLLGAKRPAGLEGAQPPRLSGIRELYTLFTGDTSFVGGWHPERAQFATTASLPGLLKNVMNKLVVEQWEELGRAGYRWWEPVVAVEHFNSLQPLTGVLVGEVTVLPEVAEGAAYSELAVADSSETGAWNKYGGYVALTLEMFERDETHKLRQYPRKLAASALRRISGLVSAVFTANAGVGPQMTDTHNVFDPANHGNLITTALSGAAWEEASAAIYNQSMAAADGAAAPKLALDARYLLVPRGLRLTAMEILYPNFAHQSQIFSENLQKGQPGDVITVPEWTDANDWAAVADPRLAPAIVVGERFGLMPEIFIADHPLQGALFSNDEVRIKVRHWVSVFVADYRALVKANVANA